MVLDHVAECPAAVIITAAFADADAFGDADLEMIDETIVPQRFEYMIRETEGQDVLDHFLAQIVIYMKDLFFSKTFAQVAVELLRRGEITAEGFFHDDAVMRVAVAQLVAAKRVPDRFDETRCHGKIKHTHTPNLFGGLEFFNLAFQRLVGVGFHEIALDVGDMRREFLPFRFVGLARPAELVYPFAQIVQVGIFFDREKIYAKQMKVGGEVVGDEKVIEGGDKLAFRQVSFRAENRNRRRKNFFFFCHKINIYNEDTQKESRPGGGLIFMAFFMA